MVVAAYLSVIPLTLRLIQILRSPLMPILLRSKVSPKISPVLPEGFGKEVIPPTIEAPQMGTTTAQPGNMGGGQQQQQPPNLPPVLINQGITQMPSRGQFMEMQMNARNQRTRPSISPAAYNIPAFIQDAKGNWHENRIRRGSKRQMQPYLR